MANRLQLRRDGAQQWANVNPILAQGELGIEIDTSRIKIGDGVTSWNSLKYERPIETESNTANTLVKRDADGNFEAGAITASLIGNSATATRLANARQISLGGDMSGAGTFDGSANLTITAELNYVVALPHYDANDLEATGTYSQVTIDSRGRIVDATNPTSLGAYGITDAQPLDTDLSSLANMTGFGIISRQAEGTLVNRTITGGSGRVIVQNGNGQSSNPFVDLADTTVVVGNYNPIGNADTPLISATTGTQTVNVTNFNVDRYGRLTFAQTSPIATATQGSFAPVYSNAAAYPRYSKIKNSADVLYEAILDIASGQGEPTHTDTSDAGSWRYLGTAIAPQKGIAAFNQEDFDVTAWDAGNNIEGGFVTIADRGVDNTQLQNNRVSFADGNSKEDFELDQELTAVTGYRGFNYLNYTKVNDTTGNLLFSVNNTGDGSGGSQQLVENITVTVGVDSVAGQSTGVFYIDGVERPTLSFKRGITYVFNQNDSTNATYGGGQPHPLMFSLTEDGDLVPGGGHYMPGITYTLDGVEKTMAEYTNEFASATNRTVTFIVQDDAPNQLWYWCHHHTGQGNSIAITDGGAGEVDINVRTYFSDPDITLDGAINQTLDKTGNGNLDFKLTQNTGMARALSISSTNSGAGDANINITSDNDITISATNVSNRVNVEGYQFQDNTLSTTNATMILDPNDDDAVTGLVQIRGDLQVDGTTTTVNSTTITVQDPIITLGGEDTLTLDDNKDRGVEFRYYDTQERFGFFGWDENYADSNIWSGTGGYRFLYNATNVSEVYSGTDAPIIAGNLRLTTNTSSTWKTPTTGTLVVTGGTGISENLNVGGTTHLNGNVEIDGTVDIDANFAIRDNTTDKFTVASATGNTVIEGTVDIQLQTTITDGLLLQADNKKFEIKTAGGTSVFDIDTDNGNVHTDGTLDVDSGVTFNSTLDVDSAVTFNSTLDVDNDSLFHDDITLDTTGKFFTITNGSGQTFRVSSTNGNTDIEGSLNVGGVNTFERTNNIVVDPTTSESAITLTSGGNATFAGGVNIDKDVRIGTDLYVSDRIVVKDAGTARTRPSLLNNVDVKYRQYIGATGVHNASFANDPDANLRVAGGVGIVQDLHVGDDFYVGKVGTNDTIEFSILGESGATTIGRVGQGNVTDGSLTVHGFVTMNERVTINGPLTTIGDASSDVLTVNAVSQFTDDVTVDGSLTVNTNALIEGNLTVNGTTTTVNSTVTTIDDPIITVGGDTAPSSNDSKDRGVEFRYYDSQARLGFFGWDNSAGRFAVYHAATNSSEAFGGTRSGIDAGSLKLFDTTNASNSASGTLIVGGGAGIGLDLHVGDDLIVVDDGSFGGNVDITGTLDVTDDFAVSTNFTVDAQTGNTFAAGTFQVNGNTTIGNAGSDAHSVSGTVQFNHAITSTDITADNIKIGVDGASEISTTSGNLILDSNGGTVNITDNADVDGDLNVDGNQQLDGTLTVDSTSLFKDSITVEDGKRINYGDDSDLMIYYFNNTDNAYISTSGNTDLTISSEEIELMNQNHSSYFFKADSTGTIIYHNGNQKFTTTSGGVTVTGLTTTDTLAVNSTSTFSGAITSTDITADSVKIGVDAANEISTTAGNLVLDSQAGTVSITDDATISGELEVTGQTKITDSLIIDSTNEQFIVRSSLVDRFTVDTDNGNTFIAGTATIEGLTTINDNLGVTGAVDFDTTLNVDGQAVFQDNLILNADNKAFKIQNNSNVDQFTVDSDNGNTVIGGTAQVDESLSVGTTSLLSGNVTANANTTATRLAGSAAIMVPNGGITVFEDSFFGEDIFVGPDQAQTITLFGATGNITAAGTVSAATFSGTTGNISTITTTSNVNVGGSIIVNTNKFIVTGASGDTEIAGTLDVAGTTVIDDTLRVTNDVDFDTNLNVDGNQQLDGTLTVDSTSLFKDDMVIRGASKTLKLQNGSNTTKVELQSTTGNITAAGAGSFGSMGITNNLTVGGTIVSTGQITGNVTGDLTGNADTASLVNITETASSNLTYYPVFVSSTSGNTEIRTDSQNLNYNPFENRLTVTNFKSTTDFEIQGNLNITGNITFFQSQVGSIANHDTDALTEGSTNLYYTNERVDDRVAALIQGGTGIDATYDDANNLLSLSVDFGEYTTDQVVEGTSNKYFTQARTRNAFTYGTGIEHDGSGGLQVTQADINTDNVTEGSTNLFTTAARTRGHISVSGDLGYNASTGVISYTIPSTIASLSNHDTDDLAEGSNLYFTNERVDDRVNNLFTAGTGITKVYDDAANTYTLSVTQGDINTDNVTEGSSNLFTTAARTRTHFTYGTGIKLTSADLAIDFTEFDTGSITEGSNLYYTNARADARVNLQTGANLDLSSKSTSNLSEGTNLYFTNARADARIAAATTSDLTEGSNLYYTDARADARIAAADTGDLSEGSNLYHTTARARAAISAGGDLSYNSSTGVMSVTLPTVFSGNYNDLSNKPSLFSGAYNDLTGKPTLGTAAATASTDYATAAQGALAASALQAETITLAEFKSVVAASSDFDDFKSRVALMT